MGYLLERAGRLRWQFGNWDLAPNLELSDACTVQPLPTRFENFFFMHEIVQLVLRSHDLDFDTSGSWLELETC